MNDRDYGDENDFEHPAPSTGLCARPWCEDAALPDDEFCAECLAEVEAMLAEVDQ